MTTSTSLDQAAPLPAQCVDCGLEVADEFIFRVVRRDRAGGRYVVCRPCADRAHAEVQPTPLQVQHTPPPRLSPGSKRQASREE